MDGDCPSVSWTSLTNFIFRKHDLGFCVRRFRNIGIPIKGSEKSLFHIWNPQLKGMKLCWKSCQEPFENNATHKRRLYNFLRDFCKTTPFGSFLSSKIFHLDPKSILFFTALPVCNDLVIRLHMLLYRVFPLIRFGNG